MIVGGQHDMRITEYEIWLFAALKPQLMEIILR